MKNRAITTLFMLESLDGKISSGNTDELDADKDWCQIDGVKEGLHQYYEIESTTDYFSLNTGRVMAKIGVNDRKEYHNKVEVKFIIIDNKPHLNEKGIDYICNWGERLILVTTNKKHVAYSLADKYDNLDILYYEELDLTRLLEDLFSKYNAERVTIQSGGSLNGLFLRNNLIDYVNIVIAPLLVGGKDVSTLIDGEAISCSKELDNLKALELIECNQLDNSYIQLKYKVKR
ncbi:MAG: dihydrofolate reductase family protein [Bacilli bacterium]|nr:dihydrofolate reductase family protein [Bacilli bacterium]